MRATLALSNFGVNEGAVGEKKILGMKLRLGWHTSIADYTNEASQKLNHSIFNKLQSIGEQVEQFDNMEQLASELDLLGPIVQTGQELEAVFASNDFANASVGNNQFKLPALWKTMDALVGVTCYTNCMSGKDRTGKVEENAKEYLDEIFMNTADHKKELSKEFSQLGSELTQENQHVWKSAEKILTAACFKKEDLQKLKKELQDKGDEAFKQAVKASLNEKINAARTGLGMERGPEGFMEEKKNIPRSLLMSGVQGIPTNVPKQKTHSDAKAQFPDLAESSMYSQDSINPEERNKLEAFLNNSQREAENRRLSQLSGSLQVTQMNTGKPGFKVEGGEPLARFSSGFDRDFVINKLLTAGASKPDFVFDMDDWMGLHELDPAAKDKYHHSISKIKDSSLPLSQKIKAWTKILQEVEEAKLESLAPQAKVKG